MPLTTEQLLDRLTAILPQFAEGWSSPDNLFRDQNGGFTYCGVFAECSNYVRDHFQSLFVQQRKSLAEFIEECMKIPGDDIDTAVATCFLENLVGESFAAEWEECLGPRATEFVRKLNGT
jgi:hypothetical protein